MPLATVEFVKDGKLIDMSQGFDKNTQNAFIQINPASELKEENQYTADISISIKRDGKIILTKQNVLGESFNDILQKAQKNDLMIIKTVDIKRKNSKGEWVAAKVANPIIAISIQ